MRVHLIKRKTIEDFVINHASSRSSFDDLLQKLKYADWNDPNDIKSTFGSADILGKGSSRVVFNVGGNSFRLIAKYYFGKNRIHLFVCWIGTHREYDIICNQQKQYSINIY
jgi:mRNA interferase HigB